MTTIWVDPAAGSDSNDGNSASSALRTLTAAWTRIPLRRSLTSGYRIKILPGTLLAAQQPNYWEGRWGAYGAPIIIESAQSQRVQLAAVNIFDCRHLYFVNVAFVSAFDPVHCERCMVFLLRNVEVRGQRGSTWEGIKVNQCKGVYIESSSVTGADDNAIDMVAVEVGHILDSRIGNANWCIYHKGGSAHHVVARNQITDCGESGYAAGQGTGAEFMESPYRRYEAYDIRVINNVICNVWGAALGVWGGHNVLYAYNTLHRVGRRSHAVEVKLGDRSCDGNSTGCAANLALGGWGPSSVGGEEKIPNKGVIIANNIIYNDVDPSQWQHLTVDGPVAVRAGTGVPGTQARADDGLYIKGNLFWNGGPSMPIGVEDASSSDGCGSGVSTCNLAQLMADNAFNTINPLLDGATFRPALGPMVAFSKLWKPLPLWPTWDTANGEQPGNRNTGVSYDISGASRSGADSPGALLPATR